MEDTGRGWYPKEVPWICDLLSQLLSVRSEANPAHRASPAHQPPPLSPHLSLQPEFQPGASTRLGKGSHLPGGSTAGISGFSNDPACPQHLPEAFVPTSCTPRVPAPPCNPQHPLAWQAFLCCLSHRFRASLTVPCAHCWDTGRCVGDLSLVCKERFHKASGQGQAACGTAPRSLCKRIHDCAGLSWRLRSRTLTQTSLQGPQAVGGVDDCPKLPTTMASLIPPSLRPF